MKKIITILLAIVCVLSCFVSCSNKATDDVVIAADGKSDYAIYRADKATEGEKDGGGELRTLIKEKTGIKIDYSTDDKFGLIEGKKEIVIGNTNREASKIAAEGLGENQFRFLMVGDTLAIAASNTDCLEAAAQTFVEEYATKSGVKVPSDLDRTWQCKPGFNTYEVENPVIAKGADPYCVEKDGVFYYCWSGGGGVKVSKADSLDKISTSGGSLVWKPESGKMWSSDIWAPELHYVQGNWYIYVAADDGENANHRMYVMKGTTQDPTDPFEFVGKITDSTDMWAIDGTVLQVKDELYFVWSGWPRENSGNHQELYIAHMSDPTTIDSERVSICAPDKAWESPLCEGPIAIYKDGDIYLLYSGNGSWGAKYSIGYLKLKAGADPMKKASWIKNPSPILSQNMVAQGPGHCSTVTLEDGSIWIVYHANLPNQTGDGNWWSKRSVWLGEVKFQKDGSIKPMQVQKVVNLPKGTWFVDTEITK